MQTKKLMATSAVALFLLTMIPSTTYAFGGFGQREGGQRGNFQRDPEVHAAVQEAFENADYDAFVEATGKTDVAEDQFEDMLEKHAERAAERAEREAGREEIEAAVESGDYDAWKVLVEDKNPDAPILEKITESNFSKLQELHELKEEIKELQEELGIEGKGFGPQRGSHGGRGMRGFQE